MLYRRKKSVYYMKGTEQTMADIKIYAIDLESEALEQIEYIAAQKAFENQKIRIMPDAHKGQGAVIGFTATLGDYVIPNTIGVDIACGMLTVELGNIDIDFEKLDDVIRKRVPSGRDVHDGRQAKFPALLTLKCHRELKDTKRMERSLGTLGGGNHFIEMQRCDNGFLWIMVHSGSRNFGLQVAEHYNKMAKKTQLALLFFD
jgi:RNA-splicing ligase RtcB